MGGRVTTQVFRLKAEGRRPNFEDRSSNTSAFSLSTCVILPPKSLQPIYLIVVRIVPHFEPTNLRGIVRDHYSSEELDETDSHGGSWISRWILRRAFSKSESFCVFPAADQDVCSREAEWPHDSQRRWLLHRTSTSRFRSARPSEAGPDHP